MTLETIKNVWMVPGHDHRARQRQALRRTKSGRLPLGEKGLGRFAAHKLGNRIELITRAADQLECVVMIDWTKILQKESLSDVRVEAFTRDPSVFRRASTGTRITISDLRERNWSRGEIRRLQRQITTIASPFRKRSDRFQTRLEVPGHDDWVVDVPDVNILLQRAPWRYTFSFADGRFDWNYVFRGVTGINLEQRALERTSQVLLMPRQPDPSLFEIDGVVGRRRPHPQPLVATAATAVGIGPVRGQFFVFDRDRAVLNRLGESQLIRQYLDEMEVSVSIAMESVYTTTASPVTTGLNLTSVGSINPRAILAEIS